MQKYLVDVYVPSWGEHLDVYLPMNKKIGEVIMLLGNLAVSVSGGSYKATADSVLLNAANGEAFNFDLSVYDVGIRNSSRLILI